MWYFATSAAIGHPPLLDCRRQPQQVSRLKWLSPGSVSARVMTASFDFSAHGATQSDADSGRQGSAGVHPDSPRQRPPLPQEAPTAPSSLGCSGGSFITARLAQSASSRSRRCAKSCRFGKRAFLPRPRFRAFREWAAGPSPCRRPTSLSCSQLDRRSTRRRRRFARGHSRHPHVRPCRPGSRR